MVGDQPVLADQGGGETAAFLERSTGTDDVTVIGLLEGPSPVIGLSYTSSTREPHFVIYAEAPVPEDRTAVRQEDALFADLDYALYLGEEASTANLLGTSRELPLPAPTAAATVPFGDQSLRLVVHPRGDLMGGLSARLPWVTAVLGLILGLVLAGLTERLGRRRRRAEALAQDNARLYTEQRSVAHTVQHSLLPVIPACPDGLEIATYYQPGVDGTEVGGDWYDVVDLPGGGLLVVVGDVAGRGLRAATVMALLRHATRAYAADGDGPEVILPKLTRLLDREGVSAFATMLCLELDPSHDHVRVVNAGHPRALLVTGEERTFLDTPVGPPVGVRSTKPYPVTRYDLPAAATLLAFTDGLVERRGESVDSGHGTAPVGRPCRGAVERAAHHRRGRLDGFRRERRHRRGRPAVGAVGGPDPRLIVRSALARRLRRGLTRAAGARGQMSTCRPSSMVRSGGRLKKAAAPVALRCMMAKRRSRQRAMPSPGLGRMDSLPRK